MESLFTRLYKYRQRENKSDLENFSTELLAYCLETNLQFQKEFLELIGCKDSIIYSITTQQSYPILGRPDIEIMTEKSIILIENKVESFEGYQQLDRYSKILEQYSHLEKYLIYLTKYYENKNINSAIIKFKNIKWWDLNKILTIYNDGVPKQFSHYLIENSIAMDKNFKNIDIVSLENISSVISKMDEVLDSIKNYFGEKLGSLSKDSSRSTRLYNGAYYNYKSIGEPWKFNIDIGFFWWARDGQIYFGTRIWIPFKTNEKDEIINFFRNNLDNSEWEEESWEKTVSFGAYKTLNEILSNDTDQIPDMNIFLKKNINTLHNLKQITPQIFE